jgi:hypothetical protein
MYALLTLRSEVDAVLPSEIRRTSTGLHGLTSHKILLCTLRFSLYKGKYDNIGSYCWPGIHLRNWGVTQPFSSHTIKDCSCTHPAQLQIRNYNIYMKSWLYSADQAPSHCMALWSELVCSYESYRQSVEVLGRLISPVARPPHTQDNTNLRNADRHPCLEWDSKPRS